VPGVGKASGTAGNTGEVGSRKRNELNVGLIQRSNVTSGRYENETSLKPDPSYGISGR
jgi:hypothetical protein